MQFCNPNEHSYINLWKVVDHTAIAEISVSFVLTSVSKIILLYSPNLMMFKDLNLSFHSVPYDSGHVHPQFISSTEFIFLWFYLKLEKLELFFVTLRFVKSIFQLVYSCFTWLIVHAEQSVFLLSMFCDLRATQFQSFESVFTSSHVLCGSPADGWVSCSH